MDLIILALEDQLTWREDRQKPWMSRCQAWWASNHERVTVLAMDPPAMQQQGHKRPIPAKVKKHV